MKPKSAPLLVTGGAGFIGANFILRWINAQRSPLVNIDLLTYAGSLANLRPIESSSDYTFVEGDIADKSLIRDLLTLHRPHAIINFAAETHVDRSLHNTDPFLHTNVIGTAHLLEESLHYWESINKKHDFRFVQVSTDEVYGSLGDDEAAWSELSPLQPNSPYAASKASADTFVRAYNHSFGLPTLITRCTNNFGPLQFPEKLIPLTILNAIEGKAIPLYGDGAQSRNWLSVFDHCSAIEAILQKGRPGDVYNIGSNDELTNFELVNIICNILDELLPSSPHCPHKQLITFIKDRPGHDRRYALDSSKIRQQCGWSPQGSLMEYLRSTVKWYLENPGWRKEILSHSYREWIQSHYEGTL